MTQDFDKVDTNEYSDTLTSLSSNLYHCLVILIRGISCTSFLYFAEKFKQQQEKSNGLFFNSLLALGLMFAGWTLTAPT